MATPIVFASYPARSLFKFPPHSDPQPIPPPHFDYLFTIPENWYAAALDPKVPITIAAVYAVSAKLLNAYNRSTGKKPWAISKTRAFHAFVVLHNVFLAVYSAWTWYGMLRGLQNTIVSPNGPDGWAGTIDSFCKMNGPAGLKNAQTYNMASGTWASLSGIAGSPSRDQSGRLWNNGLAFYGWLFYISKFYEVFDTLIILAKGKFSSTLQTYHHAGAMMAMWAGMRYMSAPIWIFVFFNSAIHSLMYTYYTVTAFNIRVPTFIKRSLTSLQISQFIIGASAAMVHSFISYLVPVQTAASGTKYQKVDCIDTTGQTFAIWLNVFYLAPLTYLFVSFFIASYLRRSKAEVVRGKTDRRLSNVVLAEKASWDAARGLEREMYGESNEGVIIEDSDESTGSTEIRRRSTHLQVPTGKKY
ncbi:putative fatty acid elongase-like protein [Rosellinia necatrix]|uniref:Elongation of fatty acids protein n=1 Tax=Rosellinia necatrix TaxID=77044 RepID=A0A1W2TLQ9_ROSNE|nr:putative fatty acid elongase-like protein [Rosellinia necatrix]